MKINGIAESRALTGSERTARVEKPAAAGAAAEEGMVQISSTSSQLAALERELSSSEEFDASRVDAIRKAMKDGQFSVSSDVVAERLMNASRELLGK